MDPSSKSDLSAASLRELDAGLGKVSQLGANVITAWRRVPGGLQVVFVPSYQVPAVARRNPRILQLDRELRSEAEVAPLLAAGCREVPIRLALPSGPEISAAVNGAIRAYSITHFECRAIALFDIVSFSLYQPVEQTVLVNVLAHYIRLAGHHCRALGMPSQLRMTTTGDGFYVWNAHYGVGGDVALFCAIVLALSYTYAARSIADGEALTVPRLRCGVHFGSHYEFYQGGSVGADVGGYVVGEVTINLARLVSKARPGHFLVGAYNRMIQDGDATDWPQLSGLHSIDTLMFMALAQDAIGKLVGTPFPGGSLQSASVFFTGPRVSDNSFRIRKYYVKDKHGLVHGCYNARVAVKSANGTEIGFGLRDDELGQFESTFDEAEDIILQLG